MTLRYVPATDSYEAEDRDDDMVMFDQHSVCKGRSDRGGHVKSLAFRAVGYLSSTFQPRCETPLLKLVEKLSKPFKSLYRNPPTEEDRDKVNVPKSQYDQDLEDFSGDIRCYDRHIKQLQSSSWFINQTKKVFNRQDLPVDDKADENLPIAFSCGTRRQVQNTTNQFQHTCNLWENSKGLSRNSKRVANTRA